MGENVREERMLGIRGGGELYEIPWNRIEQFVMEPKVAAVPGAPARTAGMMEFKGELIGLCYPGEVPNSGAYAVVLKRDTGGFFGLLADEIDGGVHGDT